MRTHHFFCGTAIAGLLLMNATNAAAQTAAPQASLTASPAWAKSVKITAVAVPETDEAALLGLSMWRFDMAAPKPEHIVELVAEVQEKGKAPQVVADLSLNPQLGWPLNDHLSVVVGQYPLPNSMGVSVKTIYMVRLSGFRLAPVGEKGSSSVSGVHDNPFNGLSTMTPSSPEQRSDGSFLLSYGAKVDRPITKPGDAALIFRVEERAY